LEGQPHPLLPPERYQHLKGLKDGGKLKTGYASALMETFAATGYLSVRKLGLIVVPFMTFGQLASQNGLKED